jgi:hypothetical protein
MYGLNNKSVVYMLEQFDSIEMCSNYKNKYVPRVNTNEVVIDLIIFRFNMI